MKYYLPTFRRNENISDNMSDNTNDNSAVHGSDGAVPECVRFQEALAMYRERIVPTKSDASVVAEMQPSTFVHRSLGRRSAEDFYKSRRLLSPEEEDIVMWRCEVLQRCAAAGGRVPGRSSPTDPDRAATRARRD